jgi:hypothetical protein
MEPEYIERKALDKALTVAAANDKDKNRRTWAKAICVLHDLQAADVVPVVHCRHCRSYNKPQLGWCSVHLDREGPDDFCGYGKRNEVT